MSNVVCRSSERDWRLPAPLLKGGRAMAELEFERRLERLFGDAPAFSDEKAFAMAVERKLARGWTLRRMLIGAAGLVGGVVGASQLILSNFVGQVEAASRSEER